MSNKEIYEELDPMLETIRKESWNEGYKEANKLKEPDLFGRENVNFSLPVEDEKRKEEYKKQRIERGFDDSELWNLDSTILKFILPRLKRFKECTEGYPCDFKSFEEWQECLDKMINSIEKIMNDDNTTDTDYEGFELFKKHFFNLWW